MLCIPAVKNSHKFCRRKKRTKTFYRPIEKHYRTAAADSEGLDNNIRRRRTAFCTGAPAQ